MYLGINVVSKKFSLYLNKYLFQLVQKYLVGKKNIINLRDILQVVLRMKKKLEALRV